MFMENLVKKFNYVENASDSIDNKAKMFLGFVVTIGVIFFKYILDEFEYSTLSYVLCLISLLLLFISGISFLLIFIPKKYSHFMVNINDNIDYLNKTEKNLYLQLISDTQESISDDLIILTKKGSLAEWGVKTFISFFIIFILLILTNLLWLK